MTKLSTLIFTLKSLGFHKEAFLISNAILERFEPAAWNICLKEVLRGNKNIIAEVKREMNNLNAEDRRKVFDIIGRFTNAEQTTILSSILNFEPEVKREFTWRDVIGVRPKKETPKVRNIDPSAFSDYALCFTKDVEATLKKTKLTGEILDRWVSEDFNNVRMDGYISLEESIESVLNEPNLQGKYILAMNLLKKTYNRDRVRLAEKLFLRVLRSRINVEKRSDDLGNLTTIN